MTDKVIEAIENGDLIQENLTSSFLRERYAQDFGSELYDSLGRGRNILENVDELDQYLYSYGKMIIRQWDDYFSYYEKIQDDTITIIDYGCGQGLASLTFIDSWDNLDQNITNFVLIDPSDIALNRATALLSCKIPNAKILTINKCLENLSDSDLLYCQNKVYIHIFSYVLDIEMCDEFNIVDFFEKITSNIGHHYIYVISHDRNHNGGSDKILDMFYHISENYLKRKFLGGKYAKSLRLQRYNGYNDSKTIHFFCYIDHIEQLIIEEI